MLCNLFCAVLELVVTGQVNDIFGKCMVSIVEGACLAYVLSFCCLQLPLRDTFFALMITHPCNCNAANYNIL